MAASDNFLCDALRTLGAKPSDSALRTAKQKYSQQVSEKVALAIAAELRQRGLEQTARPGWDPPGTTG